MVHQPETTLSFSVNHAQGEGKALALRRATRPVELQVNCQDVTGLIWMKRITNSDFQE